MSFYLREPMNLLERSRSGVEWEECACLLCGNSSWTPLVEAPDRARGGSGLWFMVVQCDECGLCFTNPRPTTSGIDPFYPVDYPPHYLDKQAPVKRPRWWHRLPLLGRGANLARKVLALHGEGRLLDFGCGSGSYLLRMRQQGWKVTGVDMSKAVVDRLNSELGLHAHCGSLPHPALENASFDVITMWQALEHVHRPLEVLGAAKQLLVPGGKLIVAVPNIDGLAFRWFGSAWSGLDLPRHLIHFTPQTLRLMLQQAGFGIERVSMVRRSGWLRDSARLASRHFPQSRAFRWLQGRTISNLASWFAYWSRQADCLLVTAHK